MNTAYVVPVLFVVFLVMSGSFLVDVTEGQRPDPVPFEDAIGTGLTDVSTVRARAEGYEIPRAEVFYSQYRYVVGYYGITSLVDELDREGHTQQFGRPLAMYVSDFSGVRIQLTDEGYIRLPDHPAGYEAWVPVEEAIFVVGSRARTPTGPTVVAFSDLASARSFVDQYGGTIHRWNAVRTMDFGTAQASREGMRAARTERAAWADRTATAAHSLLDRPVSVVVGEDAPTLEAAIERAPPNTTVQVPAGTYATNLTIDKPMTLRGAGADTHLRGDGNGSVVRVRAPRVAVSNLRISGVGNATSVAEAPGNESEWDYAVRLGYAYGDAGIEFDRANGSLVHAVTIDTPANGVLFRWSDRSVVDGVTVAGSEDWIEGFMGVMDMESRIVVQRSSFRGGRDGVYTHRANGLVVRDNHMTSMRFGVHEMYTSDALVANNTVRDTDIGVVVMTRPSGNILVDNDVRESATGIAVFGSASSIDGNVLVENDVGLYVSARRSLYERNVVANNEIGLRASTLMPTNRVVDNDVVGNDHYAVAIIGPLRVWSGNYWSGAPGTDRDGDGTLDRPFHPTGAVDGRVDRVQGTSTLAYSPAVTVLRELQSLVPGLRSTGVIDAAPRAEPARSDVVTALNVTSVR